MIRYKGLVENIPSPGHKSILESQEKVQNEPYAERPTSQTADIVERVRSLVRSDL
jgi:hypothetical protein